MNNGKWPALLFTASWLSGCSTAWVASLVPEEQTEQAIAAPIRCGTVQVSSQEPDKQAETAPYTNTYTQAIIRADVAERLGVREMRQLMSENIAYLVEQTALNANLDLAVCRKRVQCPGHILIIRFVEDNYSPYLAQPVLMGSRLEGYLVMTDSASGFVLSSHRIERTSTYEDLFRQIRSALHAALLPDYMRSTNLDNIPAMKPELTGKFRMPAVVPTASGGTTPVHER